MRQYVRLQTSILLRRLAFEVNRTAKTGDADAIHDLRVAVRRLSRCLRAFSQFYPGRSWKKVRRKLHELMAATGEVRDRDIAVELLLKAGIESEASAIRILEEERCSAAQHLSTVLHHWQERSLSRKWRGELGL